VIVIDASALVDVLLRTPVAKALEERLYAPGQTLHAPHLIDIEVTHALRRHVANGAMDDKRGAAALADFSDFPLRRYPHTVLLARIWGLRNNLTAYDAAYVALAETLDAPLVTRDRRLAASGGHRARVELV
jgi:predicted nucleic acid-binding protein